MFKKKKEDNPLKGLHGEELVDAIKNMNYIRTLNPEQHRAFEISQAEKEKKKERRKDILFTIGYHVKPVFFTLLSIMFHIITLVFRIIGSVASVVMIYGIIAWREGMMYANNAKTAVIIFPFAAFAVSKFAELAWDYFENNKY